MKWNCYQKYHWNILVEFYVTPGVNTCCLINYFLTVIKEPTQIIRTRVNKKFFLFIYLFSERDVFFNENLVSNCGLILWILVKIHSIYSRLLLSTYSLIGSVAASLSTS